MTRRELLRKTGYLGMALAMPGMSSELGETLHTRPILDPNTLPRFVDPLPIPPPARPAGTRSSPENPRLMLPFYRIEMREVLLKLHRDLPPTRLWLYGGSLPGPTFETRSGQGLWVEWINQLPSSHLLPVDHHIHGAEADKPNVRTVVHVHGAKAPAASDGYPERWYTPGESRTAHYPNRQEAAMLWYHDHAMGITRLNNFAGLAGLFMIRDAAEDALDLPRGAFEIPLVMCDRAFTAQGQLAYSVAPLFDAPWVPEFAGNTILINGRIFPYLAVQPRPYRFRVLNISNGRYLTLALGNRHVFHQIGSDQGLLEAPFARTDITLAPAERADLIVDFSGDRGRQLMLRNDSSDVMLVRVAPRGGGERGSLPVRLRPVPRIPESAAVQTRVLTLDEYQDARGNPLRSLLNAAPWHLPVTENPRLDSVEIWSFVNLTLDSHPIHLHMVRFQLLDRRPFDVAAYQRSRSLSFIGPALAPEPGEAGWKDTIRAEPGMVTRIIIKFEGFAGRYVWHCHILEHEDNEMMRPYEVSEA